MSPYPLVAWIVLASAAQVSAAAAPRTLSFEDRVRAQEAIERVYYAHQTGATRAFEEAVPRPVIEAKVRTALERSVELETRWMTPVTDEMLQREVERMARASRMPERLLELYAALGNDPVLVKECLARPVLVERLTHNLASSGGAGASMPHLDGVATVAVDRGPLPAPATGCAPFNKWHSDGLAALPDGRRTHTAVWTGTEMLIWGGTTDYNVSGRLNNGSRYDPTTDSWTSMSPVDAPSPRAEHSAVWTGSRMIVWGGTEYPEPAHATGGSYNPVTDSWTPLSTSGAPPPRFGHVALWTGSEMLIWGGNISSEAVPLGVRYRPATNTWSPMTGTGAPLTRSRPAAAWTGSRMIIWGGSSPGNSTVRYNSGAMYDPVADAWTPTGTAGAPTARTRPGSVWTGTELVVWGGIDAAGYAGTGGRFNPSSNTWSSMSITNVPAGRDFKTMVWTGSRMIVWGGYPDSNFIPVDTGAAYDPATNQWTAISSIGAPAARGSHTAVWTGSQMVVWGGEDADFDKYDTGGRYSPATDSWTPTSTLDTPVGRFAHGAVWTGNVMIVWGGSGESLSLTSGGRYDPALGTWTPTSQAGAPLPGGGPAVWAGSVMVIWGGGNPNRGGRYDPIADTWTPVSQVGAPAGGTPVSTGSEVLVWGSGGGRYDPIADVWSPIATSGAPAARSGHSAVWTGTRMLIWGGVLAGSSYTDTGGAYDPVSNSWTTISVAGAPSPMAGAAAVWSGSEMLIWGGAGLNSGGRYDPIADVWTPISQLGAPAWGTFVWTGSEMLVWELQDWSELQAGARYDLASDTWSPISTVGAPIGRWGFTAVWTGDAMIVWGGTATNTGYLRSGGIFIPGIDDDIDNDGSRLCAGECDDADASIYPGAPQACDGKNNDCLDPAWPVAPANEVDADGDGYRACGADCNDANPSVHLGAAELCNGIDDDCDGLIDDDLGGVDNDGDGVHNACDNCLNAGNPGQADADHDSIGDACDNCVQAVNADQADLDHDSAGDVCDNCPALGNYPQQDSDADLLGDLCDNCPSEPNRSQADFDQDLEGDICDADDGRIYVIASDKLYREWQYEIGYASFGSYRGSLAVLRSTGLYTQAPGSNPLAARDCGLTDTWVLDGPNPVPGEAAFHLVTGVSGGIGTGLGTDSAGAPRPNANPCP